MDAGADGRPGQVWCNGAVARDGLPIAEVAALTGVSVASLRAWEQRHGFPLPERRPGGHRRYADTEVDRVRRVVAARARGLSLGAAIASMRRDDLDGHGPPTIFAALRHAATDLQPQVLTRRAMLAVSRAMEDECSAAGERAHVAVAFQRADAYRRACQRRWGVLSRVAAATLVFADFDGATRNGDVLEIGIPPGEALRREWSLVIDAPSTSMALAGWERPDGRFEAIWTVDSTVVRSATTASRFLAGRLAPGQRLPDAPTHEPAAGGEDRRATRVTNRIIARLDR